MTTITPERQKLVDRMASVTERAQNFLALADEANRDLTESEQADFEKLTRYAAKLKTRIESLEVLNSADEFLTQSQGRKILPAGTMAPVPDLDLSPEKPTYQNLFGEPKGKHQFKNLGDFVRAAMSGNDIRLMNANMSEDVGPSGGFLVPQQYSQQLLNQALENEVIRPNGNVIPMVSSEMALPLFNYADRTGAKRAGLQMVMVGEGGLSTAQSGSSRQAGFGCTQRRSVRGRYF